MRPFDLDVSWLAACIALDQSSTGGLWGQEQWRRELVDPRRLCIGLADADQLLGIACGWLVVDELHITVLAVDPSHRCLGHGASLLRALLERALLNGATQATLEVDASNDPAIALYERFGFRTAGCRSGYYSNGGDALIKWLNLSSMAGRV
ncbi:GNAT family N-acetyltransferase [Synechococcus sp. MIT S1220]|uniref:GNAT family N-acetyltransferase n=1 Tax=Synechococcus sp. MIT S1220 TaxID=3082549 RepID=UPI0039AFE4F5